ncbi:MAG: S8 family serine peptidase [Pseudomonadota bacterium]
MTVDARAADTPDGSCTEQIVFYLFDDDRETLDRKLQKAGRGLCLELIDKTFRRVDETATERACVTSDAGRTGGLPGSKADGTTNNPWVFVDASSEALPGSDVGYGASYACTSATFTTFDQDYAISPAPVFGFDMAVLPAASDGILAWQHGCPSGTFGTRPVAERLLGSDALTAAGLDGQDVNVVIVDQGVSRAYVTEQLGGTFGGGLSWFAQNGVREAGNPRLRDHKLPDLHGNMVARNVLALAPRARIFDLPLIPPRISDLSFFSKEACFAYRLFDLLIVRNLRRRFPGPWVFVSPWSVFDRLREPIPGNYTERRSNPLNAVIANLARQHDMVFPAGNGGQFCPDLRTGPYDRGPGYSILGANGLEEVLTIGATSCNTTWIGTSSQGPAPASLTCCDVLNEKPDVNVPSWFREFADAAVVNTGTSAASAVAAGVVAALRSRWRADDITPATLKVVLRETADGHWHRSWNGRGGKGVIDVRSAIEALDAMAGN